MKIQCCQVLTVDRVGKYMDVQPFYIWTTMRSHQNFTNQSNITVLVQFFSFQDLLLLTLIVRNLLPRMLGPCSGWFHQLLSPKNTLLSPHAGSQGTGLALTMDIFLTQLSLRHLPTATSYMRTSFLPIEWLWDCTVEEEKQRGPDLFLNVQFRV